jgi:hypothetical protein
MADDKKQPKAKVMPAMTEQEIRDAGLMIDVPYETTGEPERLKYANLGPEKKWTPPPGWPPEQGQPTPTPEERD